MFPLDILIAYCAAALVVVIAPGPENFLSTGRAPRHGKAAAAPLVGR